MKQEFLVVYDYGTGGVWAYIVAESEEQIAQHFPELRVVSIRPGWMDEREETSIRERLTIDIDDLQHQFLAALIRARSQGAG
ncbi:hypothetical protein ACQEVC_07880 [Plantactinospora sp. CA-294935]|uniref:hypothetical protein n=1 Tax=Plantactinospora sp. CA-294935 TaxID=3240012 RepID=UPI003D904C21